MPNPSEQKTVQDPILTYAQAIDWTVILRKKAEQRRGFDLDAPLAARVKNRSLFFDDLLDAKVRKLNSLRRIAFYAHAFLNVHLFIVT